MIILFECLLISPTPCLNSTGWCFTVWTKPINILCWRAILRNIKLYHALLTQKFYSNYSFDSQKVSRDVCITHPVTLHWLVPPVKQDGRATAKHGCRPLPKDQGPTKPVHAEPPYWQDLPHYCPLIPSCNRAFRLASLFYHVIRINMIVITTSK